MHIVKLQKGQISNFKIIEISSLDIYLCVSSALKEHFSQNIGKFYNYSPFSSFNIVRMTFLLYI